MRGSSPPNLRNGRSARGLHLWLSFCLWVRNYHELQDKRVYDTYLLFSVEDGLCLFLFCVARVRLLDVFITLVCELEYHF